MTALPTFAGTVAPADLIAKLDAAMAALDARTSALASDVAGIRKQGLQPGAYVDGGPTPVSPFSAVANPWTGATRTHSALISSATLLPDYVGQMGVARLATGRLAVLGCGAGQGVVSTSNVNNASFNFGVRAFVYDADLATGVLTERASAITAGGWGNLGTSFASQNLLGAVGTSPTTFRALSSAPGANSNFGSTATLIDYVYDDVAMTMTATGGAGTAVFQVSASRPDLNRFPKRGYLSGASSLVVPDLVERGAGGYSLAMVQAERGTGTSGITTVAVGAFPAQSNIAAMTRAGDGELVVVRNVYAPVRGWAVTVELHRHDDDGLVRLAYATLPNPLTANLRVGVVGNLILVGYTSGSAYSTYMVARTGTADAPVLTLVSAAYTVGALGQVPVAILSAKARRAALLTRGTGWAATFTPVDLDPDAGTLVAGASFNVSLGQGLGAWTATDNVQVMNFERLTADLICLVLYNYTRSQSAIEVYRLT